MSERKWTLEQIGDAWLKARGGHYADLQMALKALPEPKESSQKEPQVEMSIEPYSKYVWEIWDGDSWKHFYTAYGSVCVPNVLLHPESQEVFDTYERRRLTINCQGHVLAYTSRGKNFWHQNYEDRR